MPRRTNDFQKLVYLVRVNLAAGATVTESKMLRDRVSGKLVEVDVCIEGAVGGQPVTVCVECQDRSRIAGTSWVNQMKAAHERLPTNALILAARQGFTKSAREVATSYGIQTVSLEEVDTLDYPALLGSKSSLWTKVLTMGADHVSVRVAPVSYMDREVVAAVPDQAVYSSEGAELGDMASFVKMLLNAPEAQKYFLTEGQKEHVRFTLECVAPRGHDLQPYFLKKIEPFEMLREIEAVKIVGPCRFEISEFGLQRGRLGAVRLAWGKAVILGQDAMFVATRDADGTERVVAEVNSRR